MDELILQRARRAATRGEVQLAWGLYRPLLDHATDGVLDEALDLAVDYFPKDSERVEHAARAILDRRDRDPRASKVLGACLSIRARGINKTDPDRARSMLLEAEALLRTAVAEQPDDTDAWGTLGGARKRLMHWSNDEGAGIWRGRMLEAYAATGADVPDAYPLLNFVEQRAMVTKGLLTPSDGALEHRLREALHIRRAQFDRGQDRPWAAFNLARGQHYLQPNVPRFLHDLEVAIDDARAIARTSSDRWMVDTARASLRALLDAEVRLDGLEDGVLLLSASVADDRWLAGNWGPLGRPPEYLSTELAAVGRQIQSLEGISAELIQRTELRWSEEDERRFEADVKAIKKTWEPSSRKVLRAAWRVLGKKALEELPGGKVAIGALEELWKQFDPNT